ncbi:MAG: hypothetical protein Q7S65_05440 [Nanoarchaeota archaeon]|nr:hypothetical protein [Nanoarchaeota archaeon]
MKSKPKQVAKKSPWAAAILNVLILGAGYLYVGKRKTFAYLLLAGQLLCFVGWYVLGWAALTTRSSNLYILLASLVLNFAFAYDAYHEAKQ